jgi:glyoxylase-like metal-dependent hydrolase (beta-lactamase superfamily II)
MHADAPTASNRVFVLRYAERVAVRHQQFYGPVDRPADPMPLSYYVWLVQTPTSTILVDTGFTAETAARFGRDYVRSPRDAVRELGFDPDAIGLVVLTHLHYDHAGCASDFPAATYVVQSRELAFWTGRHASRVAQGLGMTHLVLPEDVVHVVQANFADRVRFVDGDLSLADGVSVHLVGGHTPGMQVVRVETAAGTVVLASDTTHFYENIDADRPFAVLDSVPGALDAFQVVRSLTDDPHLVVPGHDPSVLDRFPPVAVPALRGHAAVIG